MLGNDNSTSFKLPESLFVRSFVCFLNLCVVRVVLEKKLLDGRLQIKEGKEYIILLPSQSYLTECLFSFFKFLTF